MVRKYSVHDSNINSGCASLFKIKCFHSQEIGPHRGESSLERVWQDEQVVESRELVVESRELIMESRDCLEKTSHGISR